MNNNTSAAILLFLAGAVVAAAYFRGKVRKYVNAPGATNTVNPQLTTVVDGQAAPARGPLRVWNGPVDFTVGSNVIGGYGGSARMQELVRNSQYTSPQYVKPSIKGA